MLFRSSESRRTSEVGPSQESEAESQTVKETNSELSSVPPVPPVPTSSEEQAEVKTDASEPACVTRTCSLPRQKRMGDCASPSQANVAVVSPMPHMTKSASVSETGSKKQCCNGQDNQENGDEALRGEILSFYMKTVF